MPSRRREGESLQWLLCFFLCWLVTFSQADKQLGHIMLLNTTGFDGKSTEYKNKVADLCTSNDFIFGEKNINKTDIVHYYANWTRAHRKEIEANGNEFRYLGVHLLGQPNFRCELSRGFCFEMPSCEVVATHMNLPTDAEISQPDAEELRRRYFFPKILDEEIHFQYVLRQAIFDAKGIVVDELPDIVSKFATQSDQQAMVDCQRDKAIDSTITFAVITVVAIVLTVLTLGTATGPIAAAGAGAAVGAGVGEVTGSAVQVVEEGTKLVANGAELTANGAEAALLTENAMAGGAGELANEAANEMGLVAENSLSEVEALNQEAQKIEGGVQTAVKEGTEGVTVGTKGGVEDAASVATKDAKKVPWWSPKNYNPKVQPLVAYHSNANSAATNLMFAGGAFVNNLKLFDPAVPNSWTAEVLPTLIDSGRCSADMGDFGDQNEFLESHLRVSVNDMMDAIRQSMEHQVHARFSSSTFTADGRSTLSKELQTYNWRLSLKLRDRLQSVLTQLIAEKVIRNVIGQILTAAQCYIKCVQLNHKISPNHKEFDLHSFAGNQSSKLALGTFYPEAVLAGLNSSSSSDDFEKLNLKPNLQCQFQCLRQNTERHSFFPDSLRNMKDFRHTELDPHLLFTEAVIGHLSSIEKSRDNSSMLNVVPNFHLPTCISETVVIDGPPFDDGLLGHSNDKHHYFNPKPYWNEQEGHFPMHCGNWKANVTEQFIDGMPISTAKSPEIEKFWYFALKASMRAVEHKPLTYYLTLCDANFRMGRYNAWSGEKHFKPGPDPYCKVVQEHIEGMGELEANLYFCNSPFTDQFIRSHERGPDHVWTYWLEQTDEGETAAPTHQQLCDRMGKYYNPDLHKNVIGRQKYESTFGLDNEAFLSLESDYKNQIKIWEFQNQVKLEAMKIAEDPARYPEVIFRWDLKNKTELVEATSKSRKSESVWPPTFAMPGNAAIIQNQTMAEGVMATAANTAKKDDASTLKKEIENAQVPKKFKDTH